MVEALSSERYLDLLATLDAIEPGAVPRGDQGGTLATVWVDERRRARRAAKTLGEDARDDELHAFRIRVKRLRYATELAAHELGRKRSDRVVDAAKTVQDVLGEHQDAVVAEDLLRAWSAGDAAGRVAAGRLIERARQRRVEARGSWRRAWRHLKRRALAIEP